MDCAFLVGIDAYPPPNAIQGCVNDANSMCNELSDKCGFDPLSVTVLTDEDATASAIKQGLAEAIASLHAGDRFLFWYAGHGSQLAQGNAATDVICPVNYDGIAATAVTVQEFHDIFANIPVGCSAVWGSDSCHSGDLDSDSSLVPIPRLFPTASPHPSPQTSATMADGLVGLPNVALLSACRSDQISRSGDFNGNYDGVFTYFFLQCLNATDGLTVPLTTLISRVQTAISAAGYAQTPQISGPPSETGRAFMQRTK